MSKNKSKSTKSTKPSPCKLAAGAMIAPMVFGPGAVALGTAVTVAAASTVVSNLTGGSKSNGK